MLIIACLIILIIIDIFIISFEASIWSWDIYNTANSIVNVQLDFTYVLDTFYLSLGIIIAVVILCVGIGITILASGLKETSIKALLILLGYISIWIFLSIFSYSYILSIEIFGILIYIILTFMYTIGVMKKLAN